MVLASVYAVPDPITGDQVMAALQLRPGVDALDADELADFLAVQEDLGTKWAPRFVRMTPALPVTATNKVLKRCTTGRAVELRRTGAVAVGKGRALRPAATRRRGRTRGGGGRPGLLAR